MDALFDELARFLEANSVYGALIDLPGDDAWKRSVQARRRDQIAALFSEARPRLPRTQPRLLAIIVPQLMRIVMVLGAEPAATRAAVLEEMRAMLSNHLGRGEPGGG